jgi:hypothetical protein
VIWKQIVILAWVLLEVLGERVCGPSLELLQMQGGALLQQGVPGGALEEPQEHLCGNQSTSEWPENHTLWNGIMEIERKQGIFVLYRRYVVYR